MKESISGGVVRTDVTVQPHAGLDVLSGGILIRAAVMKYGRLTVLSGGTASGIKLSEYSYYAIESGGTATDIDANKKARGTFAVAPDTLIQGEADGSAFLMNGGVLLGFRIGEDCCLKVSSGGTVVGTTVDSCGCLIVKSGGVAKSTEVLKVGTVNVLSGGTAAYTLVSGRLFIESGGTALDVRKEEGAIVVAEEGAVVRYAKTPSDL